MAIKVEVTADEKAIMEEALTVFFEDALWFNRSGNYNREAEIVNRLLEILAEAK